jgi:hypothetical protein
VDYDLKIILDTINHDRLMEQLRGKIRNRQVLGPIRQIPASRVEMPNGTRETTPQRVPQGGLSWLLAHTTRDPLDKELEEKGRTYARGGQILLSGSHPSARTDVLAFWLARSARTCRSGEGGSRTRLLCAQRGGSIDPEAGMKRMRVPVWTHADSPRSAAFSNSVCHSALRSRASWRGASES